MIYRKTQTFILLIIAISHISLPSFADFYNLYEENENKLYSAEIFTCEIPKNRFYVGLTTGDITCLIDSKTNKNKDGLLGGKCYGLFQSKNHIYSWTELNKNSYKKELKNIKNERRKIEKLKYEPLIIK